MRLYEMWSTRGGHREDVTACWLTHKLDLGHQSLLTPFPVLEMYVLPSVLTVGIISRTQPWKIQDVETI